MPNFASLNRRLRGGRWCGFRYPDHVNYFNSQTLGAMVRLAGLTVFRCNLADRSPISDSLWLVARKLSRQAPLAERDLGFKRDLRRYVSAG